MKRMISLLVILFSLLPAKASLTEIYRRQVRNGQTDFTITGKPTLLGFTISGLTVPATTQTTGFRVEVHFSTPQTDVGDLYILRLGARYNSEFFDALSILKDGNNYRVERSSSLMGEASKTWKYKPKTNYLSAQKNYILYLDLDETRMRIGIKEEAVNTQTNYEYNFEGLHYSYMKTVLSGSLSSGFQGISICVDKKTYARELVVYNFSDGVEVPLPEHKAHTVMLRNWNSYMDLIPTDGELTNGTPIIQSTLGPSTWKLWNLVPQYQNGRTPLNFKVKPRSIQSMRYPVVLNAATANLTPIIQYTDDNNNNCVWQLERQNITDVAYKFRNVLTQRFMVIKDASMTDLTPAVQWESADAQNGKWLLTEATMDTTLTDGYYKIRNKVGSRPFSDKNFYVELNNDSESVTENIWHVKRRYNGIYTFRNINSNKYMVCPYGTSSMYYPYLYSLWETSDFMTSGEEKWFVNSAGSYYQINSCHLKNQYVVSKNASPQAETNVILWETGVSDNSYWTFEPINYESPQVHGGFYRLKNIYTNTYAVVQDASTEDNAKIVTYNSADMPNAWWVFVIDDAGCYHLKNVNSGKLLAVYGESLQENVDLVQVSDVTATFVGFARWRVTNYQGSTGVVLLNNNSGMHMAVKNNSTANLTHVVQRNEDIDKVFWVLEQVPNTQ